MDIFTNDIASYRYTIYTLFIGNYDVHTVPCEVPGNCRVSNDKSMTRKDELEHPEHSDNVEKLKNLHIHIQYSQIQSLYTHTIQSDPVNDRFK